MAPIKTLRMKLGKIILQKSSSSEGEERDTKDEKKEAETWKDNKKEEDLASKDEEQNNLEKKNEEEFQKVGRG